jgi:hypothetical protein
MRKEYGQRLAAILVGTVLLSLLTVGHAFAWGSATHAYIDDHIGKKGPVRNLNEIYGGMAADAFAYLFSNLNWLNYLYVETHYENNLLVWKKADTILEKAAAFGFVSHSGMTGADATAHGTYDYSAPDGWVIAKAVEMAEGVSVQPILSDFGLIDDQGGVAWAGYELCHIFIESAVDLLLAQHDRSLGGKISAAALLRTHEFPNLLVKAYAKGFKETFNLERQTAVAVIRSAENEFRKNMVSYGFALAQEPAVSQGLVADQLAALAPAFLVAYGVTLRDDADLNALSGFFLGVAIEMVQDEYLTAVEHTIQFVSGNLAEMGIPH